MFKFTSAKQKDEGTHSHTFSLTCPKYGAMWIALFLIMLAGSAQAQWDPNTKASNTGSITNTRHNLTMSYNSNASVMDLSRNDYGEVCVYCHTPHGSSGTVGAPLWNRTNPANTYTMYSIPLTSGQTPTQPGVNSLTCLSCHDGTVAVDSVINMPGSGGYKVSQETSQDNVFLDTWSPGPGDSGSPHRTLSASTGSNSCMLCHQGTFGFGPFTVFAIGTDLTDDHPVGVQLPNTTTYDFNAPTGTTSSLKFFDTDSNGRAGSDEVRFYNTGEGYEVECASCHDPHGVASAGPGSKFIPSFLRVSNAGSTLCLTCHAK